jgi:hypothetical protein
MAAHPYAGWRQRWKGKLSAELSTVTRPRPLHRLDINAASPLILVFSMGQLGRPVKMNRSIDIAAVTAKLGPSGRGQKRVRDLSLRLLREFQCPSCRIERARRSLLVPVPRASSGGILRCYFCGQDFTAPDRN